MILSKTLSSRLLSRACYAILAVPPEVKAQYEDNIKWIEEAQQHQLVGF